MGLRDNLSLEHLRDILPIHEDISDEAIVDLLALCTLRKESSVMPTLVTQQGLFLVRESRCP